MDGGGFLTPEHAYLFWGSYVYPSFGLPDSQKYEDGCPSPPGRAAHWLFEGTGSGKLRRIIDDGAGQTETYLAHQLPDLAGALVTPAAVLVLLLVFDWRFGLISLIPMAVGTFFLSRMMGTGMAECMKQYQNALEDMNSEAVEYVRGIPVVKTFQQSIFSFKSFHDSIIRYKNWAVNYTLSLRIPMCCYSVSINSIFAVLIPAGLLLAGDAAGGQGFVTMALDLVFYILFTPVCVTMMDKIMWTSEIPWLPMTRWSEY